MRTHRKRDDEDQIDINGQKSYSLILHNDDFHTYDYVIDALVKICGHDVIQATQCTFLVHFKESCEIKRGPQDVLCKMQFELIKKELQAEVVLNKFVIRNS